MLPSFTPEQLASAPNDLLESIGALQRTPWPNCTSCGQPLSKANGSNVARWLQRNCRLTKGRWAGQKWRLTRTQVDVLQQLYALNCACGHDLGPPHTRRYKWALVGVAKKAGLPGKTEMLGGLANYHGLGTDGEPDPLVVIGAGADEQANLLYGAAKAMVQLSPRLTGLLKAGARSITVVDGLGEIKRVSAATGTNDGPNISTCFLDELHVWHGDKGEQTWTILTNGGVVREQFFVVQITTAGASKKTILGRQYDHGVKTIIDPKHDPRFFFYWRAAPMDWPIDSPYTWAVANAGYGLLTDGEYYRDQLNKKTENDFRRYYLNQWTKAGQMWLPTGTWEFGAREQPHLVALKPDKALELWLI